MTSTHGRPSSSGHSSTLPSTSTEGLMPGRRSTPVSVQSIAGVSQQMRHRSTGAMMILAASAPGNLAPPRMSDQPRRRLRRGLRQRNAALSRGAPLGPRPRLLLFRPHAGYNDASVSSSMTGGHPTQEPQAPCNNGGASKKIILT